MQDNRNTDQEGLPLDSEDFDIVFQAYADYPVLAFILAQHLNTVKGFVLHGPEAVAGLDLAIESLMPRTRFRDAGRRVYMLAVTGTLSVDDEQKLRELGILE